ncbi:MAG TPA: M15 family metallopeptidase [Pyrinomonadaceae bacterium]
MNFRSYQGKVFVVESNKSVVRGDNLEPLKYRAGEEIPDGKNVGDVKIIPQRTEIRVADVKVDDDRHTFVLALPAAGDGATPFGWTSCMNLDGGFANETAGLAPSEWALEPEGANKTCTDARALIRSGPPSFASTGATIPAGTFLLVTETSDDRRFVRVSKAKIAAGLLSPEGDLGWTAASNLSEGCADFYSSPAWQDQKGPNACWDHGNYVGQKILVNIVGYGGEMEQVTLDSLGAYMELKEAAEGDNLQISINSAFRTFPRQVQLFKLFKAGKGNLAAEPGRSNHQHGQAFDLNTRHNDFSGADKIYEWLKRNAPQHGFVRTVSKESWHWEYRPAEARNLAAHGQFKMPGVSD